jgi:hypothetical protein
VLFQLKVHPISCLMSISGNKSLRNLKRDRTVTERITEITSKNFFLIKQKSTKFEIFSTIEGLLLYGAFR